MCHGELWTLFVKLSTLQQSSICNNFQRARPAQSALQVCGFGAVAYFLLCRIKKVGDEKGRENAMWHFLELSYC
jgi:hypothetical protein